MKNDKWKMENGKFQIGIRKAPILHFPFVIFHLPFFISFRRRSMLPDLEFRGFTA